MERFRHRESLCCQEWKGDAAPWRPPPPPPKGGELVGIIDFLFFLCSSFLVADEVSLIDFLFEELKTFLPTEPPFT